MAKFKGKIGFVRDVETFDGSGVFVEERTEKPYYVNLIRNYPKWDKTENVNDDLNINNKFSILANSFVKKNIGCIRYVEFEGTKWKIISAEVEYPRIVLYVGGIYNE